MTFESVDPGSGPARAALARYFAELDARFAGGFDVDDAADVSGLGPPGGDFVLVRADGTRGRLRWPPAGRRRDG